MEAQFSISFLKLSLQTKMTKKNRSESDFLFVPIGEKLKNVLVPLTVAALCD